jgi:hypothetical protein
MLDRFIPASTRRLVLRHVVSHHALELVREPEPVDGRVDEQGAVVRHDAPVDGDLDVLAILQELPAVDGPLRDLGQVDACRSRGWVGFREGRDRELEAIVCVTPRTRATDRTP